MPGVDYMILHNLYYEWMNQLDDAGFPQTSAYKGAINLMDNEDNGIWPINLPNFSLGIVGVPLLEKVFQNLSSHAQIFATASPLAPNNTTPSEVEYRAGKEIALLPEEGSLPGFSVEEGSNFQAHIQRYLCSNSDYGNGMRSSEGDNSQDYESDDMNTSVPTHFVKARPSNSDKAKNELAQSLIGATTKPMQKKSGQLSVVPNPGSGLFELVPSQEYKDENFSLSLLDSKGMILLQNDHFKGSSLDLSEMAPGIYLLYLKGDKGSLLQTKIVITR
jgi:hypothetical protein